MLISIVVFHNSHQRDGIQVIEVREYFDFVNRFPLFMLLFLGVAIKGDKGDRGDVTPETCDKCAGKKLKIPLI